MPRRILSPAVELLHHPTHKLPPRTRDSVRRASGFVQIAITLNDQQSKREIWLQLGSQRKEAAHTSGIKGARLSQSLRLNLSAEEVSSNSVQSEKSPAQQTLSLCHFVVVTVVSTSPLESRRTVCVTRCTATAEFACGVAVTPSFTCAQSMRSVPLSLNTSP